jgi:hypothetical protein
MPLGEDANNDLLPAFRSSRSEAKTTQPHQTLVHSLDLPHTGVCRQVVPFVNGEESKLVKQLEIPPNGPIGMQATCGNKEIWGHIWHASHLLFPQSEQVTTNGDNKSKPPNITEQHHNDIPHTHTITQEQTTKPDYTTHDNKKEHTTTIIKTTNQNHTINQNHRRHTEKKDEKNAEQDFESKFYF